MKQLLLIFTIILSGLGLVKAEDSAQFTLESCTPVSGSEISSFEFTLKFDLSNLVSQYGEGEYGVGYYGYYNKRKEDKTQGFEIFKGDKETGTLLTRYTESVTGASNNFVVGNEITVSIDDFFPEPNQLYTLYISNDFKVYRKGETAPVGGKSGVLSYLGNPLAFTYTGVSASQETLAIEGSTIKSGDELETLDKITYQFNQPVARGSGDCVLSDGSENIKAKSCKIEGNTATFDFGGEKLYTRTDYVLTLESGTVISASNPNLSNKEVSFKLTGLNFDHFSLQSVSPDPSQKQLSSAFTGIFLLPEGSKIGTPQYSTINLDAKLYKGEVAEDCLIEDCSGTPSEDGTSITWSFSSVSLQPETEYILHVPKDQFYPLYTSTGYNNYRYKNDEVRITFTTPSIAELGYPPIELGDPVIGKHDAGGKILKNGDNVDSLNLIEIAPPDYFYKGKDGNSNFHLDEDTNKHTGYLYDITTGTPQLIKEVSLSRVLRETSRFYYSVISVPLNTVFFEGHKYRFVIPKDEFTILYPPLYKYVRTPEYSIEFNGSTPTEAKLLSCTLQEGEERSSLGNVIWTFKGQFELNPEAEAILERTGYKSKRLLTSDISYSGNTDVVAHIYSSLTGDPLPLHNGEEWTLTLPEGTLYYQTDPTIKNKEIAISFKGIDAKPEVKEPEFVNVEVCIEGVHTTTSEAVKGRKLTLTLTPDEFWEVAKLLRDGDDVSPFLEDGRYTTPDLNADTRIEAALKCKANVLLNETPSSVMEIPDSNVKVYSDGAHIIVEGLNVGDTVAVYTVNGMLITSQKMTSADNNMQITADTGVVYIVRVNDKAVKIQH